jgi:hypothetical protein
MGQSYVMLTFDSPVNTALASLVSRVGYLCPSPLVGKGLVPATDYHVTCYYGFQPWVTAVGIQEWLDSRFSSIVHLRFVGLRSHLVGRSTCFCVGVESFGLLQLNYWLADYQYALVPKYKIFRPHVTLGYFTPGFDLGRFPPADCPFGPGGGLSLPVGPARLQAWFVDGATKAVSALRLPS